MIRSASQFESWLDRGLVAVAAAGITVKTPPAKNLGTYPFARKRTFAITVGAVDPRGTDTRSDDTIRLTAHVGQRAAVGLMRWFAHPRPSLKA